MRWRVPVSAMAMTLAATAAAPAMSIFINSIDPVGLMLRPPASKVIPLPTSAMVPDALGGR